VKGNYFALLHGENFSKAVPPAQDTRFLNSYTVKHDGGAVIKNYCDKTLPAECYEIRGRYRFAHNFGWDKFKCTVTHTTDTFFCQHADNVTAVFVSGEEVNFETSLAEKTSDQWVYINVGGTVREATGAQSAPLGRPVKIFIIKTKTKLEATEAVREIKQRGCRFDYLLTADEIANNRMLEALYTRAYVSRFVTGENLAACYREASRYVPTLHLPTLVYTVEETQELFDILDAFNKFKQLVSACGNLNIVILYSSQNDIVRGHITAFTDRSEARDLIDTGVFLFFVDKVKIPNGAVYYLSRMQTTHPLGTPFIKGGNSCRFPSFMEGWHADRRDGVVCETVVSNSYPITHTVIVNNTLAKAVRADVSVPLDLGGMRVVSKKGSDITAAHLGNGKTSRYKLPAGAEISDNGTEFVTDKLFVQINCKLAGFEEKIFKIIKNENVITAKQKKEQFIGSLVNITVKSSKREFSRLFELAVTDTHDEVLLSALKSAIRNFDSAVFFALLSKRDKLPADVFALIIEKVVGLKLLRGTVQLAPNVLLAGGFELSFEYGGRPYHFNVREKGSGFTVLHDGVEHTNFLQVSV